MLRRRGLKIRNKIIILIRMSWNNILLQKTCMEFYKKGFFL